jgi:hypothetical protein
MIDVRTGESIPIAVIVLEGGRIASDRLNSDWSSEILPRTPHGSARALRAWATIGSSELPISFCPIAKAGWLIRFASV